MLSVLVFIGIVVAGVVVLFSGLLDFISDFWPFFLILFILGCIIRLMS